MLASAYLVREDAVCLHLFQQVGWFEGMVVGIVDTQQYIVDLTTGLHPWSAKYRGQRSE